MIETGVFRNDFAEAVLRVCLSIKDYHMLDSWRNLDTWNKPANKDHETFERYFLETVNDTDFASINRNIIRGKTTEVIDRVNDESLDFAYIDRDHTLRGIAIDLIAVYSKIRENG